MKGELGLVLCLLLVKGELRRVDISLWSVVVR